MLPHYSRVPFRNQITAGTACEDLEAVMGPSLPPGGV